jgi:hypothetical protein
MRKIPDIPSRKPKDPPALGGGSQPDRSLALRIAERDETWMVASIVYFGIGYFAGADAWIG